MSDEQDVERARLAQHVLENPVYADAHAAVEAEIVRQWRESRDAGDREQLHQLLLMHGKGREALEAVMRRGEVALSEIQRRMGRAEAMARVVR